MNDIKVARFGGRQGSIMVTTDLGGGTKLFIHRGVMIDIGHTGIIIELLPIQIISQTQEA